MEALGLGMALISTVLHGAESFLALTILPINSKKQDQELRPTRHEFLFVNPTSESSNGP